MLAAHRHGGRTSFLSFARAWDRFTDAPARRARRATDRELSVLAAHLEGSLLDEDRVDLGQAIADHRSAVERRARAEEWTAQPASGFDWRRLKLRRLRPTPRRRAERT
jgi:hypothetical protein